MPERPKSVRLPLSSPVRSKCTWLRLLQRTNPARYLLDEAWQGALLTPGVSVAESALRPGPDWPSVPVLLECAGVVKSGWGHRRSESLYILWRYVDGQFRELARAVSSDLSWARDLQPLAQRAIDEGMPAPSPQDAALGAERILEQIDVLLASSEGSCRALILARIYNGLAGRVAAERCSHASDPVYTAGGVVQEEIHITVQKSHHGEARSHRWQEGRASSGKEAVTPPPC